jgi:hypothetical protein
VAIVEVVYRIQEDGELVTADAGGEVAGADGRGEALADAGEGVVPPAWPRMSLISFNLSRSR